MSIGIGQDKNFATINSETSTLSLPILQSYDTLSTTDRQLLQKILTFVNILDVNKDANNKISVPTCIKPFYNQYIRGVTNIPDTYSAIQQQLHILENRYIPTLRDVKLVDEQQTGINRGYKTLFIVPLQSSSSRPNTPISPSSQSTPTITENYLRKEYNKCTVDVAFNPRKYNPEIQIYETPGSYIDPGDRTNDVDKYIPINPETIDLTEYGLPGIIFTATKQDPGQLDPNSIIIDIIIKFDKNTASANFDNIETIKCSINRRQELQGDIQIKFYTESMLKFSSPNIFDGNGVKNSYVPVNCNNKNPDDKTKSNVFLLGKLLGDLLQIVYVERLIPQAERNQFILFTNDLVVALRCVMFKIPFLLSANYRQVSASNCNILYFYDDITAIQQLKLIIGEKQKMIKTEITNLETFKTQQLSPLDNLYFKSYIKSNMPRENPATIDKILSDYNSELQSLSTRASAAIEQVTTNLESCISDLVALDSGLDNYNSDTEIPDFSQLLKIISSIKIDPQIREKQSRYIFTSNKKFTTVKLLSIQNQNMLIKTLVDRLNDSRIQDPTISTGRTILLKDLMQIYQSESINSVYPQMKRQSADDRRTQSRLESHKKRAREQQQEQEKQQKQQEQQKQQDSPIQLKPMPMQQLPPIQESIQQPEPEPDPEPMEPSNDSDSEDDDIPLSVLAKRQRQEGGSPDIDKIDIDFETENIYNIFYSYCNYHGITIIKNQLFNRLIEYIITQNQQQQLDTSRDFVLDDPIIAKIYDDAKTSINETLKSSSQDYDIEQENADTSLTDPEILTSTVLQQIRVILQSIQTPEKVFEMHRSKKDKENLSENLALTKTIKKKSKTRLFKLARGVSRKALKKLHTKRKPRVHLKKTRRKTGKRKSRKRKSRKKHTRKHTRK